MPSEGSKNWTIVKENWDFIYLITVPQALSNRGYRRR